MGQTRINLKHLLEDIRDSYPCPAEETIVSEMVANALDSGAATLDFTVDPAHGDLTIVDDGRGMGSRNFKSYHDIAASTKSRGRGIGFAGVGAKISLLLAESVYTESRSGRSLRASRWRLENPMKAPWRFQKPLGLVGGGHGTAVRFHFTDPRTVLLDASYLESAVRRHFLPLFHPRFRTSILDRLYAHPIVFRLNGRELSSCRDGDGDQSREFEVRIGSRRSLAGFGVLSLRREDGPEEERGVAVSTYGKVIKRGWDWLGLTPRQRWRIVGLVEVPSLSALLTTNKADFLRDPTHLKKYYRIRKAVLKALAPHLAEFGEASDPTPSSPRRSESQREIERALSGLIGEFPELAGILDAKRRTMAAGPLGPGDSPGEGAPETITGVSESGPSDGTSVEDGNEQGAAGDEAPNLGNGGAGLPGPSRRKGAGLRVVLEERPDRAEPAWLSEEVVRVNSAHPAYLKAAREGSENYHAAVAVAWALSAFLQDDRSQTDFLNRFLTSWGGEGEAGVVETKGGLGNGG